MRRVERRRGPAALFGVARERAVVDREPRGLVASGLERCARGCRRATWARSVERQRHAHLVESRAGRSPTAASSRRRRRRSAPSTQSTSAPPPCAATWRTAAATSARSRCRRRACRRARPRPSASGPAWRRRRRALSRAGDVRVGPRRRRGSRRNQGRGCSRSRHTASPSAGCPSAARARRRRCARRRATISGKRGRRRPRRRTVRARDEGTVPPVARPRGAKARAAAVVELLRELYPDAHCALDHTNAYELLVATILSAQTTDERVNMVTPTLFAQVPDAGRPRRRRSGRGRGDHPVDGLLPLEDEEPHRHGAGGRGALRRRGPGRRSTISSPCPGVGRKTGNVVRSVWFHEPGLAGRHARHPAVGAPEAHRRDRPGEDRARPRRDGAARGVGRLLAAAHRARPPGVRRAPPALRRVRARRHLPVGRQGRRRDRTE